LTVPKRSKPHPPASSRERIREAGKALFARKGFEATSTVAICRLAGTSESQLIKHFGGKQGLLEAIFQSAWDHINPALRLATQSVPSPREKFRILTEMVLNFLHRDRELQTLFLLEGRRIRKNGELVSLVDGFLEFVALIDGIIRQMAESGDLAPDINPEALRSGLMGAIEGMLRDLLLAESSQYSARYSEADMRRVVFRFLSCSLTPRTDAALGA